MLLGKIAFALACSVAACLAQATPQQTNQPSIGAVAAPHVIAPMDILSIKVLLQANLSGLAQVAKDGTLSLPLIGKLNAGGLTANQLNEAITERLKDFLNEPIVNVAVVSPPRDSAPIGRWLYRSVQ
jgi:protein involved in polysaccharide export with SLBB domain